MSKYQTYREKYLANYKLLRENGFNSAEAATLKYNKKETLEKIIQEKRKENASN